VSRDSPESEYESAYNKAGYKASIKNAIKWFWENDDAVKYFRDKQLLGNKVLISKDEMDVINYCVEVILENPHTLYYFRGNEPHIERLLQVPIYWELEGERCKSLLDGILIDHKKKTIQPLDLKSTAKAVTEFPSSFYQFGYYRQAAFYSLALKEWIKERAEWDTNNIEEYEVLPFIFIVVSKNRLKFNPALIYECSNLDIHCGLYGGKVKELNSDVRGVYSLLEDYKWHKATNKWLLPREAYENGGKLQLNIFYDNLSQIKKVAKRSQTK
jgi:hypothetical protein